MGNTPRPTSDASPPARWGPRALAWVTILLVFILGLARVTSFDTWVHLSLGRWMAEHGRIPRANLLSHTMPERPTLDHQWLFQLGLYGLWRIGGAAGAIVAKAAVVAAAFALTIGTARRKGAGPLAACLVVFLAALAARFRFTLRPQVAAFALFAGYLLLLERWRAGRERGLLLLLPLQVLWANLHGSAVLGVGLALGFAAGESLRSFLCRQEDRPSRRQLAWLWAAAAALVPLTLANPHGWRLLAFPFTHAAGQAETGLKPFLLDRAAVEWHQLAARHVFFALLAALALLTLIRSIRRRDATEAGLLLGLLAVAVVSERFIGLFALAAAPIVANNATRMFRRRKRAARPLMMAVAVLAMVGVTAYALLWQRDALPPGLGPDRRQLPNEEVAFIQEHHPEGNLLNEFEHGGFIAWSTRRAVFIDSRGLLAYEPGFVQDYVAAWNPAAPLGTSRQVLDHLIDRFDLRVALVGRERLKRLLAADPAWRLALRTRHNAVFVRAERPAQERTPPE